MIDINMIDNNPTFLFSLSGCHTLWKISLSNFSLDVNLVSKYKQQQKTKQKCLTQRDFWLDIHSHCLQVAVQWESWTDPWCHLLTILQFVTCDMKPNKHTKNTIVDNCHTTVYLDYVIMKVNKKSAYKPRSEETKVWRKKGSDFLSQDTVNQLLDMCLSVELVKEEFQNEESFSPLSWLTNWWKTWRSTCPLTFLLLLWTISTPPGCRQALWMWMLAMQAYVFSKAEPRRFLVTTVSLYRCLGITQMRNVGLDIVTGKLLVSETRNC